MNEVKPKTPVPGGAAKIKAVYMKHKKRRASKELIDGLRQNPSGTQEVPERDKTAAPTRQNTL